MRNLVYIFVIIAISHSSETNTIRNKTVCYNYQLIVDNDHGCSSHEMLLPLAFLLGTSSDSTCHSLIQLRTLYAKEGPDGSRRCCKQRPSDTVTMYYLPSMKDKMPDNYVDFVNKCTGREWCSNGLVQTQHKEDYVNFQYVCINNSAIMHLKHSGHISGKEVYLYSDQTNGSVNANCTAYSKDCYTTVSIEIVAQKITSPTCKITFNDGTVMDCKNLNTTQKTLTNHVDMHIYMAVSAGATTKEFLWIKANASSNRNITVACGPEATEHHFGHCPTTKITSTSAPSVKQTRSRSANVPYTGSTDRVSQGRTVISTSRNASTKVMTTDRTAGPIGIISNQTLSSPSGTEKTTDDSTDVMEPTTTPIVTENTTEKNGSKTDTDHEFLVKVIGISAGTLFLLVVIITAVVYATRRKKQSRRSQQEIVMRPKPSTCSLSSNNSERVVRENSVYAAHDDHMKENSLYGTQDGQMRENSLYGTDEEQTRDNPLFGTNDEPIGSWPGTPTVSNSERDYGPVGGFQGTENGIPGGFQERPAWAKKGVWRNYWVTAAPIFMQDFSSSESAAVACLDDAIQSGEAPVDRAQVLQNENDREDELSALYAKVDKRRNHKD